MVEDRKTRSTGEHGTQQRRGSNPESVAGRPPGHLG
jgi:hypothetical protein